MSTTEALTITQFRPVRAVIHPPAFAHNLARVRERVGQSNVWAVIKADGYGHGLERVAEFLKQADGFGVACLDEALRLREAGCEHPIVVLEGVFSWQEWPLIWRNRLECVVHSHEQLQWLAHWLEHADLPCDTQPELDLWLKFDTGMQRLGFEPGEAETVVEWLRSLPAEISMHLMSHLACADEDNGQMFTQKQCALFDQLSQTVDGQRSLANSAGVQTYPKTHYDWVRPGIMLYGASARSGTSLAPTMTLMAEVTRLRWIEAGSGVGYGLTWQAQRPTLLAVVSIGYGDGYPRHAPSGTPVLIHGCKVPLVGRVSMDMITVDVTDLQDRVSVGDAAILWGQGLAVDEVAQWCGTIGYELLCGVTPRVPRQVAETALISTSQEVTSHVG
ncbi:alanine racemase [Thiomicrospira sp. WB1]|uniref:alanine racemase n=1 Tax=Thiomicrospira sp. WB1 TaxID=1685380 RepID=UPI0007498963|nr:alanine racemase [Thiomicrospira sp. WB1]KUJ72144.1 alanine racemase [Thiomicrospira sp. WB1]